jgi:hypothetical protein
VGRFLGSVLAPVAPVARSASRKVACELRTEEGDVLLSGTYERRANEVVKRCAKLFKGQATTRLLTNSAYGYRSHRTVVATPPEQRQANRFAWTIVGPDGAVRTRHAITVLS